MNFNDACEYEKIAIHRQESIVLPGLLMEDLVNYVIARNNYGLIRFLSEVVRRYEVSSDTKQNEMAIQLRRVIDDPSVTGGEPVLHPFQMSNIGSGA